jgi:two-component system phosphate regulon sensor histidine kinase PhoR
LRGRIFFKILAAFFAVILTTALMLDVFVRTRWESSLRRQLENSLIDETKLFAARANQTPSAESMPALAQEVHRSVAARATIIDRSGQVLADTEADPLTMENHAARPEFAAALRGSTFTDSRWSKTRQKAFLYTAVPFEGGAVRLAVPLTEVEQTSVDVRHSLLKATLLALLGATLLSAFFAHATATRLRQLIEFSRQVADGDLSARFPPIRGELGILATGLNETAAELERTFAELHRAERFRRDFLANVSHELRTPLTAIQGFAETLLERSPAGSEEAQFLEIIRRNSQSMSRLTDDVLRLAELESGEPVLSLHPISAGELIGAAAERWRGRSPRAQILLEQIAPRSVMADADAIGQVFSNLIENALRYAPNSARIELAAREADAGVEFSVRDFGPGIAPEHLPRIFERFYRADKARSRSLGGTGLGLAIVKHIIMLHHGSVRVESSVGEGTTFFFTLPYTSV